MGPFLAAWLLGEGIIVWRAAAKGKPPVPGQMLAASGLFALLALLAQYQPARGAATALAYGVDLAVLLKLLPGTGTTAAEADTATAATSGAGPAAAAGASIGGSGA